MADKVEGDTTAGRSQTAIAKPERSKSKRKAELATITEDLTGKFLRVGNRLFRASDDKTPTIRIEPNRRKGCATLRKSRHCA